VEIGNFSDSERTKLAIRATEGKRLSLEQPRSCGNSKVTPVTDVPPDHDQRYFGLGHLKRNVFMCALIADCNFLLDKKSKNVKTFGQVPMNR